VGLCFQLCNLHYNGIKILTWSKLNIQTFQTKLPMSLLVYGQSFNHVHVFIFKNSRKKFRHQLFLKCNHSELSQKKCQDLHFKINYMPTHFICYLAILDFENNCIHTMMKTWTFHTSVWKYLTLKKNVIWLHNLCYALLLLQLEIEVCT
jgi:hypothetical protein